MQSELGGFEMASSKETNFKDALKTAKVKKLELVKKHQGWKKELLGRSKRRRFSYTASMPLSETIRLESWLKKKVFDP